MEIHLQRKDRVPGRGGPQGRPETAAHTGRQSYALITLVIVLSCITAAATAADPTVIVTNYTVSPAVLMPGDTGTITLTIKNTAQEASEKENSGIVSGGTFTTTKSTDINVFIENVHLDENGIGVLNEDFDRIGELGPGQSVPVTFVIRAPARSGIYFPEAWIDVKDGRSTRYPLLVNVNTDIATQKKPSLSIAQELPDRVVPGETGIATITVKNTGLARAGDISLVATPGTKSLVLTSTGRLYIDHLDPGEQSSMILRFATDRSIPVGIDPITLTITYENPDGTTGQQIETVGIPVRGRADIAVSSITTDPVRPVPGNPFTLIIRVENTGTDRATSVRATLDSPFTGTRDAFIGSLDKDSDAPAIFYLQATANGEVPANLTIRYTDDHGSHTISEQTEIVTGQASGTTTIVLVFLLGCIIAGGAYWYLRIRPGKGHAE